MDRGLKIERDPWEGRKGLRKGEGNRTHVTSYTRCTWGEGQARREGEVSIKTMYENVMRKHSIGVLINLIGTLKFLEKKSTHSQSYAQNPYHLFKKLKLTKIKNNGTEDPQKLLCIQTIFSISKNIKLSLKSSSNGLPQSRIISSSSLTKTWPFL